MEKIQMMEKQKLHLLKTISMLENNMDKLCKLQFQDEIRSYDWKNLENLMDSYRDKYDCFYSQLEEIHKELELERYQFPKDLENIFYEYLE